MHLKEDVKALMDLEKVWVLLIVLVLAVHMEDLEDMVQQVNLLIPVLVKYQNLTFIKGRQNMKAHLVVEEIHLMEVPVEE